MSSLTQIHVADAVQALSRARLKNYRTFFGAVDDRAAYGLYCWNDAISASLSRALAFTEIALRNQFHAALSARYGEGAASSRDWYAHLCLNPKSTSLIQKITHERRRVSGAYEQIPRSPAPSPDDVVSKLSFGFWPHVLDISFDNDNCPLDWPAMLMEIVPGHRHSSLAFWSRPRNRDNLFARIDFCKDLRNRIAHLEPVWKAGPLMTEGRARVERKIRVEHSAPANPAEALARLQIAYERVLELLKWLSPSLGEVYMASEAHHCFESLNRIAALNAYKRHGGHRRIAALNLNAYHSLRRLKKELRGIGRHHGAAEVRNGGRPLARWIPVL
ncbi:hypothetical protein ASG35_08765 [Burkholderia sp. Leaf177]|uniref:Abi family protein n=1 Tax=Burkholderia sp. Leaf177 TaxID=1736287 RepID=UPI000714CAA7|nr:Abi family protein [Burkholderia sp. Leaf177]KQR78512.1 hypothetical protein ASG35_08765 [Burkholderia sp. Leaf177]